MSLESIEALRVFVQVVDSGGLTAAGRIVGLSPTLVSRRISRLEDDLGVRLLHRTTRTVRITDEGRAFYRRCRSILSEVEAAAEEVRAVPGEARGRVRAVLPTVTSGLSVMEHVGGLLARHPALSMQLSFSDQPVDLVAGGWDIAAVVGRPQDSTHVARQVVRVAVPLAATPEYLATAGIPQSPEDLARHSCLRFISDGAQDTWPLVDQDGQEREVPVNGRLECDNSAALGDALRAHLGIGPLPWSAVRRGVDEGRLVHVLPGWRFSAVSLWLLMPQSSARTPRVRVVADWLTDVLAALGAP